MQITDTADTLRMIKAIAGASSLALVEARADQPFSLRLEPGQEVRGEVVASLVNGRFLVKIAGDLLDMNLPSSIKPGETVQLTFMADKPRLTFSLEQQKSGAPVSLSDAGRWLTLLARTPMGEQLRPEDVTKAVQAAVKDAVFLQAEDVPAPLLQRLTPGQQIKADVLAELPNGRFQLKMGDQLVEMSLPRTTRLGSELQLMFVSSKPQASFVLVPLQNSPTGPLAETARWLSFAARTAAAAYPSPTVPLIPDTAQHAAINTQPAAAPSQPAAGPAGQPATAAVGQPATAPAGQPATAPAGQPAAPPVGQSGTAPAGQSAATGTQQAATVSTPAPFISTTELAGRLREALGRSGIFYESHLADWSAGKEKTDHLLREPQGRLSPLKFDANPLFTDSATAASSSPIAVERETSAGFTSMKAQSKGPEPADPQTLSVVRQQLAVLQTGIFAWQGEAWTGQPLEWSVSEREAEAGDTPGRRWNTTLSLDLPQLGRVQAELNLKDGRLKVMTHANPETALLMEQNEDSLREGLAKNGLVLTDMVFTHEE